MTCRGNSGPTRVQRYLVEIVKLFSPELIIFGGGASKRAENWVHFLDVDAELAVASMENNAGIVGAALMARGAERRSLRMTTWTVLLEHARHAS